MKKPSGLRLEGIDGLSDEKRVRVLGVIDKVRELGISENVSLPQLAVIGDQSSGKSLLLEGMTGLSFPIASDLCTRFVTQIVLRRTSPGEQGAAECMGIPGPSTKDLENLERRFSDDILKIELSGPQHHHLSVVDVPGMFHNSTKYQTDEDRAIIRSLIDRAVMDARNKLANQEVSADSVEKLTHGWFAVKNRSTQEIKDGVRIEGRHMSLLYSHIRGEFPDVLKEIQKLALDTQRELEVLGPSRQTSSEQRRFLTRIANTYQQGAANALSRKYDPELDVDSPLKLRMNVHELGDKFAEAMARKGHAKIFRTVKGVLDPEYSRPGGNNDNTYRHSRGAELPGTVHPVVLESMFCHQSSPWRDIASIYIQRFLATVHEFNCKILAGTISDNDMREQLQAKLSQAEAEFRGSAIAQLSTVLNDERGGILQTVNHYFADTLSSVRQDRILARLRAMGIQDGATFNMNAVLKGVHLSNEDQAVNDIHDILKAYYKVTMKRFTDNIVLQVTERYILGPGGHVKTLSSDLIGELQDNELRELAGENFATSTARTELALRCEHLQKALDLAEEVIF
ncbi:dynamin [Setomelanomma holmii]|uniref:Dynamin n=1 Tax=Setomelanomma holmii TaxID=210430 RepID=A0A9P4LR86_9PLEO|nr:dynamin [Setomelanomma holmii]